MGFIKKIGMYVGILFVIGMVANMFSGGEDEDVKVVDLDVVLDSFIEVADGMPNLAAQAEGEEGEPAGDSTGLGPLFVKKYAAKLQEVDLFEGETVGIGYTKSGAFVGYADESEDGEMDEDERAIFTVEVDAEQSRLIATDVENSYHREGSYRSGSGFLTGFLIARMVSGQRSMGVNTSKFKSMSMSPRGYHSAAKTSVRSSRSARSTGSGSFRSGK